MLADGKIAAHGAGHSRRYRAVAPPVSEPGAETFHAQIPISADNRDILAYVEQPPEARRPVGYQRDFLDAYEPGETWYLPEPLRRQLRRWATQGKWDWPPAPTAAPC